MTQVTGDLSFWIVTLALGVGSFLLRFSFLGLVGKRPMPEWLLRHLRYTAVSILPALVAPLILWRDGPGSGFDLAQIAAATLTLSVGIATKSTLMAIFAGFAALGAILVLGA